MKFFCIDGAQIQCTFSSPAKKNKRLPGSNQLSGVIYDKHFLYDKKSKTKYHDFLRREARLCFFCIWSNCLGGASIDTVYTKHELN